MKATDEGYLKSIIEKLNNYILGNQSIKPLLEYKDAIMNTSLQEYSFKSDLNFFSEVSFILSVIASIISHPHLLNKGEEVVIRSELAPSISPDMFLKTIKDSRLWTENDFEMIPERVYYYQQIDELRIYENIFIVMLIKKLELEMNKYYSFYMSLIDTYRGQEKITLRLDNTNVALKRINYLNRKLKHIKNTYFFRTINRGNTNLGRVIPTNILVKDRLYNYCYKFYKKLIGYEDRARIVSDIRMFYLLKLIANASDLGFSLVGSNKFIVKDNKITLESLKMKGKGFNLNISFDDANMGLRLVAINNGLKNESCNSSKNLLVFDDHSLFKSINIKNRNDYDTINAISLWNLCDLNYNNHLFFNDLRNENELIRKFLNDKLQIALASNDIYTSYCPICKSDMLDNRDGVIYCSSCRSKYAFYKNDENSNNKLWFIRIGRK